MIKIEKDLENIPDSLLNENTLEKRDLCIKNGEYNKKFNQRFKQRDTKELLKEIYNDKCAFCEQKIVKCIDGTMQDCSSTIEHYRPKSIYYWLAFSWDNLLWCCHRCNEKKADKFEIEGQEIQYDESFQNNVHSSATIYKDEYPKMIHPELEDVRLLLNFERDGTLTSNNERVKYTIQTCELDREDLKEKRKKIFDKFIKEINAKKIQDESIGDILISLFNDVKEEKEEFIAFRYWILKNHKSLIGEN